MSEKSNRDWGGGVSSGRRVKDEIEVPTDILEKATTADHFETFNIDRPTSEGGVKSITGLVDKSEITPPVVAKTPIDTVFNDEKKGRKDTNHASGKIIPAEDYALGYKKKEEPANAATIGKLLNIKPNTLVPQKKSMPVEPSKLPDVVTIAPPAEKKPAPVAIPEVANTRNFSKKPAPPVATPIPVKPSADKPNDTPARGYWAYIENANPTPAVPHTGETYAVYPQSGFESVRTAPLSTFSADVDTASFANVRRFLTSNQLPPVDAVRIEELINYFKYHYETIKSDDPFGVNVEAAACPWNPSHRLVRVAIKAQEIAAAKRPAGNFVFLIDVSGSMRAPDRLPLVKEGLKSLVSKLGENDCVAIVTYAGQSGIALQSTNCTEKAHIIGVIDSLVASGGTNGGAGIQTAYALAKEHFIKGGVNRIVLATDGDFNMGVSPPDELVKMIEGESKTNVCLTALGYGMGNLKDAMLQRLADAGHGNYAYIDSAEESRKVLIEQMNGTLVAVAKDVKFQVEFNPANAQAYRLIGYEKRALAAHDFNNDAKDAGNVGAGHTVTAFYEVVPTNASQPGVDPLKYQSKPAEPQSPRPSRRTASARNC